MALTENETYKLKMLRKRFTIDVLDDGKGDRISCIRIANCWKFASIELENSLDNCLTHILAESYRNDADVKKHYEDGLASLSSD